jgi:hypothetical protein
MKQKIVVMFALVAAAILASGATSAALPQDNGEATNSAARAETERARESTGGLHYAFSGDAGVMGDSRDPDPALGTRVFGGCSEWIEEGDTLKVCDIDGTTTRHVRGYIYIPDGPDSGTDRSSKPSATTRTTEVVPRSSRTSAKQPTSR